jgi:hypothetical protein
VIRTCTGVLLLLLLVPALTHAQPQCDVRGAVGGAVGWLILDTPVDPTLAGVGRNGLASTTGTGLEGSVHAIVPISAGWGFTTEAGFGSMAVALERDDSGASINQRTGDDVKFARVVGGLLKTRAGMRGCTYFGVRGGLYRYSYRDVALNAFGISAMMGGDIPLSESGGLFFEIEFSVAFTKTRPPLTPNGIVPNVRPSFGYRYRF